MNDLIEYLACLRCCASSGGLGTCGCQCRSWVSMSPVCTYLVDRMITNDGGVNPDSMFTLACFLHQEKEYAGATEIMSLIRANYPNGNIDLDMEKSLSLLEIKIAKETNTNIQEAHDHYVRINELSSFISRNMQGMKLVAQPSIPVAEQGKVMLDLQPAEPALFSVSNKPSSETTLRTRMPEDLGNALVMPESATDSVREQSTMIEKSNTELIGVLRDLKDEIRKLNEDVKSLSRSSRSK